MQPPLLPSDHPTKLLKPQTGPAQLCSETNDLFMVRRIAHATELGSGTVVCMEDEIKIGRVERDGEDGITVTFSDGIQGDYVVEELLELRLHREPPRELLTTLDPLRI
jgi:hypothetical protein